MGRFENKTIVVTGGNSGIGFAAAKRFAHEGARLVIVGRNQETLEAARMEFGQACLSISADLSLMPEIERVAATIQARMGHVDVLFANAGVGAVYPFEAMTEKVWDWVMNVNLKSVYFLTQKILPLMERGGSIVFCGSIGGVRTYPGGSAYCASKAALRSFSGVLSNELAGRGIRVNIVSPGPIDTPVLSRTAGLSQQVAAEFKEAQIESVPLKRIGSPAECAAAVLFLASDDASYITGSEMVVDGGTIGPT